MAGPAKARSRSLAGVAIAVAGALASVPLFASPAPGPALRPLGSSRAWQGAPSELAGDEEALLRRAGHDAGSSGTARMTGALWLYSGVAATAALTAWQRRARGTVVPRRGKDRASELKFGGRTSMLARLGYILPTGLKFAEMPKGFSALAKVPGSSWSHMVLWCAWMRAHQQNPVRRKSYARTPKTANAGMRETWTTRLMNSLASTGI